MKKRVSWCFRKCLQPIASREVTLAVLLRLASLSGKTLQTVVAVARDTRGFLLRTAHLQGSVSPGLLATVLLPVLLCL